MIGRTLGHYEIIEPLGAGGMGEVYRAHDTTLKRDVAIKVLPEDLSANVEPLARLEREAHLLASLNHSNIASIYGLEDSDDVRFIVMEVVEGETLAERINRSGRIEVEEALDIARQIAEALEAAHRRGIIHRDLKPANVMVTHDGRVKVLDFGLAKVHGPGADSGADLSHSPTITVQGTRMGVILGTAAYMSPEQARGKDLDWRSDIWSFGCVLYETLTARKAFGGETVSDVLAAILKDEADWSALPAGLPVRVEDLLRRCLSKEADRRPHDIADARLEIEEVLAVLRATDHVGERRAVPADSPRVARPGISSIAVLPLANLSGDKEQEYFSDGMTEALITDLAKIRALKVISRTSVMRYKGSTQPLPEIARELGVDSIVEGSVLRAGDEVRITAQLIDAASDTHLWADSYDRDMTNILSLQREVAQAIVREVKVAVTPEEEEHLAEAHSIDPEAYEAYLKGRFHWLKISPEHIETAFQYFQRALGRDPDYAQAHAGIALVWAARAFWGIVPLHEAVPRSERSATRALELDEDLAEGHHLQASLKMWNEWDWAGAEVEYKLAIELDPSYVDARIFYSQFLISMRRFEEGRVEMERALEIDPLSSFSQGLWGVELLHMRRYEEAIDQLQKSLRMEPDLPMTLHSLWIALHQTGMYAEALSAASKFYAALGDPEIPETMARGYAEADYPAAMRSAAEALVSRAASTFVPPVRIALLYAHAGEKDLALDWLEAGYEERSPDMVYLQVWHWDAISDDPRFQDLLRRMNFPQVPTRAQ